MLEFPSLAFPPPSSSFPPRKRGPRSRSVSAPAQADLSAAVFQPAGCSGSCPFRFPRESGGPGTALFQRLPRRTSAQRAFSRQDVRVHVPLVSPALFFVSPAKAGAQEPQCFSACLGGPQRGGLSAGRMLGFTSLSFPPRKRGPRSRGVSASAQAGLSAVNFPPAGYSQVLKRVSPLPRDESACYSVRGISSRAWNLPMGDGSGMGGPAASLSWELSLSGLRAKMPGKRERVVELQPTQR